MQNFPIQTYIQSDFFLNSFDETPIALSKFTPTHPKAIFILVHGMQDHKNTHYHFAQYMAERGFLTYCYDHRGEGATAGSPEKCGFIAENDGWLILVKDMNWIIQSIHEKYPNLPIVLFAHSMGSFAAESALMTYPLPIKACILCGSTYMPPVAIKPVYHLLNSVIAQKGPQKPIPTIEKLVCYYFCRRIWPHHSRYDWVCANPERTKGFINDPYCGWLGSISFYRDLLFSFIYNGEKKHLANLPKKLPIFLVGGKEDSLSNYGYSLKKLKKIYEKAGVENIDLKLYPKGRHELMNETFQTNFFNDLIQWIDVKIE